MKIYKSENEIVFQNNTNHSGGILIDSENGATNGFCIGLSIYYSYEYGEPGLHSDQEGFFVLEGFGHAKIANEEFDLYPGLSFIANTGIPHTIKRNLSSVPVKLIWAHGAK